MSMQSWQQTLSTAQVAGSALTAAAAASALPAQAKFTLPANTLTYVGQQLLIKATGIVSVAVTTPGTVRYDVRFGGTVVADSLAMVLDTAGYTNVGWNLEMLMTLTTAGAAAQLTMQGNYVSTILAGQPATPPKGALTAILPWNSSTLTGATFDATAAQQVDFFFTQTVATGSMTLKQYSLWLLN